MSVLTKARAVVVMAVLAATAIGFGDGDPLAVATLVVCATALPAIAAVNADRKGARIGGREGIAWRVLAVSMLLMVPIYPAELAEAYALENVFITAAYLTGIIAILMVPLPAAGPYRRMVAGLDALAIGVVVATTTFWITSGSGVAEAGNSMWAVSDATIIAMVAYVSVRRSQRHGIDWGLLLVIAGVGAYLGGLLISFMAGDDYRLGHPADFAYIAGMALFALACIVPERRTEPSRDILRPVRWAHVLAPYVLAAVLVAGVFAYQVGRWVDDATGSVLILGALTVMVLVLIRQLAMIADQRRRILLEQRGVIATISHELRTPLTSVVGYLDLLEDWDQFPDREKMEMVEVMRKQSHVLARVVADLVDVARDDIAHVTLTPSPIDVDAFVATAITHVPELAHFDVRVHVGQAVTLNGDHDRMLQLATNYLSNAAKYGSSRVSVVVYQEADDAVIEVHDDGPGVPEMFEVVIWERFERGSQRQGAIPGSGIGLSVARGIAQSHGGETSYRRSERLGGSCFSARIPVQPPPAATGDGRLSTTSEMIATR